MSRIPLLISAALVAAAVAPARADGDPKITFEKYKLPNGLEVILAPDTSRPLVAVNVWYHVGSGDEVPGKSGFAHLFEHMMFQGTKNTGDDAHFKILRSIGATVVNGSTTTDRTNYFEVVPSNQLETALWLESERMGHLLGALDAKQMANQIDVVRNERRQNWENYPYRKALFAMYGALYPEPHPYHFMTIGRHEDLENASVDDVKKFFETWYVPANATITIAGDFDSAEAHKLIDKWFGTFPVSKKPEVVKIPAPVVASQEITVKDQFAKLPQITFAWETPAYFADGDAQLDVAAHAMAAEGFGTLYKTLVYDKQLAQSVSASQDSMQFSSNFTITVTLRNQADLAQVKQIVLAEVARLGKEDVNEHELARVVAEMEARSVHELENLNQRAEVLQRYNHFLGDPDKLTWDLDRYRKTTPDQVRATVAKYLVPDHMITVITEPAGGAK